MKLTEIKRPKLIDARYRITLSKTLGGAMLAWQTRLTAGSQQEAVDVANRLFKKQRGEIQDAVMQQWELSDVTPLAQGKK
jgi:uncharacterized protein YaaQ